MKTGIIAFFDILGYQSFLKNNPDDGAQQVVSKLVSLREALTEEMRDVFSHHQDGPKLEELLGLVKWLIFSDTIMLYSEFDEGDSHGQRSNRWIVMNFASLLLWRRMFQFGLPLRGVIHTGGFLVEEACFAGEAIVDAYNLTQDIDLAVAAYSPAAFSALIEQANTPPDPFLWSWIPTQLFEFLLPRKTTTPKRMHVINPLTLLLDDSTRFQTESIRQLVMESFLGHNKDIPASARSKVDHTEDYLRASVFAITHMRESADRMLKNKRDPEPGIAP